MNIAEMIMTVLITVGIGKFSEYQSPKYYELETIDGNVYNVKIEKIINTLVPFVARLIIIIMLF